MAVVKPLDGAEIPLHLRSFNSSIATIVALGVYEQDKLLGSVVARLMTKVLSAEILILSQEYASTLLPALETILREKNAS